MTVFVLAICLSAGCGENKDKPAETKGATLPLDTLGSIDKFVGQSKDTVATPNKGEEHEEIELPTFASIQPRDRAMRIRFMGWTKDESSYVIQATHVTKWPNMDAGPVTYELFQVHDTLSGKMTKSFRGKFEGTLPTKNDRDLRLWKQAKRRRAGKKWRENHPLVGASPAMGIPGWTLELSLVPDTIAETDRIRLEEKSDKFEYEWTIVKTESDRTKAPQLELRWKEKKQLSSVLVQTLPFRVRDFYQEFSGQVVSKGTLTPHISPSGKRVVIVTNSALMVDNDAFPLPVANRYIRSLGPQIKIVDSGNTLQARKVAKGLESLSMPATIVEASEEAVDTSGLYYRNLTKKQRGLIHGLVPAMSEEKLSKKGWVDGIIVLAPDA